MDAADPTAWVATFLVERYWPGVTVEAFTAAAGRIDEEGMRLRAEGATFRTVSSTLVLADEAAYWVIGATSRDTVELAFARAGVPVERIVEAVEVRPGLDLRPVEESGVPEGASG